MNRIVVECNRLTGLKEVPGEANNQEIMKFFREIGHTWVQGDETAWCAAAANAILQRCGFPHTGQLFAKSFLGIGERVSVPVPLGSSDDFVDICLFYRGGIWQNQSPRIEDFEPGHVSFFINERGMDIYCKGGNQSNRFMESVYHRSNLAQFRRIYKEAS